MIRFTWLLATGIAALQHRGAAGVADATGKKRGLPHRAGAGRTLARRADSQEQRSVADDQRGEVIDGAGDIRSPCIGVCELDLRTDLCRGCLRSVDEIAVWRDAGVQLRLAIIERIRMRRECLAQEAGPAAVR